MFFLDILKYNSIMYACAVFVCVCVLMRACIHTHACVVLCHGMCVEAKGQLSRLGPLLCVLGIYFRSSAFFSSTFST